MILSSEQFTSGKTLKIDVLLKIKNIKKTNLFYFQVYFK